MLTSIASSTIFSAISMAASTAGLQDLIALLKEWIHCSHVLWFPSKSRMRMDFVSRQGRPPLPPPPPSRPGTVCAGWPTPACWSAIAIMELICCNVSGDIIAADAPGSATMKDKDVLASDAFGRIT
jgi:hypothetical protein